MIYAQFYQRAVWPAGTDRIIEACGDRSVIILDGRRTLPVWEGIARDEALKRGYVAYSIHSGKFTDSKALTLVTMV